MAFLKNRITKLELQSGLKVSYEDIIRFIHHKDTMDEREIHRITSSRRFQEMTDYMRVMR